MSHLYDMADTPPKWHIENQHFNFWHTFCCIINVGGKLAGTM